MWIRRQSNVNLFIIWIIQHVFSRTGCSLLFLREVAELLAEDKLVTVTEVDISVGDHLLDALVDVFVAHGSLDIIRELLTDLLANCLGEFGLDVGEDLEEGALGPFEGEFAAHLHDILFDILVQDLVIELRG